MRTFVTRNLGVRALFVLVIGALMVFGGCGSDNDDDNSPAVQTYEITGIVQGSVLSGGVITVTGTQSEGTFTTTSDSEGRWRIRVPSGTYHVMVSGGTWINSDGSETENRGTLAGSFTTGIGVFVTISSRSTLAFCGVSDPEPSTLREFASRLINGEFELAGGGLDITAVMNWYTAATSAPDPADVDDDGDGYTENQNDCDDTDAGIHPGATEICGDTIDQDCDGSDLACPPDPADVDDDGDGYTENQNDCDDTDSSIHPGATETCGDTVDQDCNGSDPACVTDPNDVDNDGDGYTENQGDLDDTNATTHPGATEICGDNVDNDCDGQIDEGCATDPLSTDDDGDGYSENQGDCNDANVSIHPGATEICGDFVDNNCDYQTDEGCATDPLSTDDDGDGYSENQGDCNDTNAAIHPGATEICGDSIDQDCNGSDCGITNPNFSASSVNAEFGASLLRAMISHTGEEARTQGPNIES